MRWNITTMGGAHATLHWAPRGDTEAERLWLPPIAVGSTLGALYARQPTPLGARTEMVGIIVQNSEVRLMCNGTNEIALIPLYMHYEINETKGNTWKFSF